MKKLLELFLILTCCSFLSACSLFDQTAPELSLSNKNQIYIEVNTDFDFDQYVVATDNRIDSSEIALETTLDSTVLGSQEISVSATDLKENTSSIQFSVEVVDTTAPELTLVGDSEITIAHGAEFIDEGANVNDNYDSKCTVGIVGAVDTSTLGDYPIQYVSTDSSNNASVIERLIHVVDLTGPEIQVSENEIIELTLGELPTDDFGLAFDAIDGPIDTTVEGNVDYMTSGDYELTFSATDFSGNTTTETRTIRINPLVINCSNGINMSINFFKITDTGMFYMDNTVLSIDVTYENTTDKSVCFQPSFAFHHETIGDHTFNIRTSMAYMLSELEPNQVILDNFDITYSGDSSEFYEAKGLDFEMRTGNSFKTTLEHQYEICITDLVKHSFDNGIVLTNTYSDDTSEASN